MSKAINRFLMGLCAFIGLSTITAHADCYVTIHSWDSDDRPIFRIVQMPDHFCNGPYYTLLEWEDSDDDKNGDEHDDTTQDDE